VFVALTSLPLTENGKVDRKALPPPEAKRTPTLTRTEQPATEIERDIARIWADVLRLDEVPLDENFFDLGGHSLLFAQVQNRLEQRLQQKISMLDLFQYPTVRALASRLTPAAAMASSSVSDARRRAARQLAALGDVAQEKRPSQRDAR
jgi:acyl carrier protein